MWNGRRGPYGAPAGRVAAAALAALVAACGGDPARPVDPLPGARSVASIEVLPAQQHLLAGDTIRLTVVARDASGAVVPDATVSWSVSDSSVAVVDANGRLLGRGHGPATVAAHAGAVTSSASVSVQLTTEERRFAYALVNGTGAGGANVSAAENATGGVVAAQRTAPGQYTVSFERLAKVDDNFRETVAVTAVGDRGERCQTTGWGDAANRRDLDVSVTCSANDGLPTDARFSVLVVGSHSLPPRFAFTRAAATPADGGEAGYTFNAAGQGVDITRAQGGNYHVALHAPADGAPRHYLVSPIGGGDATCKVASWNAQGGAGVLCHAPDGALHDGRFSLLMLEYGRNGRRFGFAWAHDPAVPPGESYTPAIAHQRSSSGAPARVTHLAVGVFRVEFPGLARGAGGFETVHVAPYGGGRFSCQVDGWGNGAGSQSLEVTVRCWNRATTKPADTYFTVLVLE